MAGHSSEVWKLIHQLKDKSREAAEKELSTLRVRRLTFLAACSSVEKVEFIQLGALLHKFLNKQLNKQIM